MTKKTEAEFAFLPTPQVARTKRFVVMATEDEDKAIQSAATRLGMEPKDVVRYAFEHLVLPGILRDMERLNLMAHREDSPEVHRDMNAIQSGGDAPPIDGDRSLSVGGNRTTNVAG